MAEQPRNPGGASEATGRSVDPLGAAAPEQELVPEAEQSNSQSRNLFKTLIGIAWMYGARGAGLLWTFALIGKLSISDYGLYAMAFAFATIIGPTLDNPWSVRAIRESEERFLAERASRYLIGVGMMAIGIALIPFSFIGFLGFVVAGGEITINSYISRDARDGHPDRVYKWGAGRQFFATGAGCIYLFVAPNPTLLGACLLYCAPYLVIAVLAGFAVRGHRPGLPGPLRLMLILQGEMLFGTTLYLQGDVLLLGWLTNTEIVGYYNIALMLTSALAAVGQSFVMTYHEPLRLSGGDLAAGPKLRTTLMLGSIVGGVVVLVAIGILLSPAPPVVGWVMLIMAGFGALRTVIAVFQVILYAQHRDRLRFVAALSLIPFKFAFLTLLVWLGLGAIAAAIATTVADAALLAVFAYAIYVYKRKAPVE
jgi:O-antigen/teichoic acid export membrane protein